jgi:hypothetical protein
VRERAVPTVLFRGRIRVPAGALDRWLAGLEQESLDAVRGGVSAYPGAWVEDGTPASEWPTALDHVVAEAEERARLEAEARVREHREAAEANKIKLAPALYRVTSDLETDRAGRPAIVLKGSVVLEDDPLVTSFPDHVELVKR